MKQIALVILAALFLQGCALVYIDDNESCSGLTKREFGFLGGCLPVWSYRCTKPYDTKTSSENKPDNTDVSHSVIEG